MAALEKDARLARNGLVRPDFGKLRALFRRFASLALRRNQFPDELAGDPARPDFQDLKPSIEIFETGIKVID